MKQNTQEKINRLDEIFLNAQNSQSKKLEEADRLLEKIERLIAETQCQRKNSDDECGYTDPVKGINLAIAAAFGGYETNGKEDTEDCINLSITEGELYLLAGTLCLKRNEIIAEHYIKNSTGKGETRLWETVAELMLLKEPCKKLNRYDGSEIMAYYSARINHGISAKNAAIKVKNEFGFPSQIACNTYICDEINRQKKDRCSIFSHLKKPSKSD